MVKNVSNEAARQSEIWLDHFQQRSVEDAVRTIPYMFEYFLSSDKDSFSTRKQNLFLIIRTHTKATLKDSWVVADVFLDLVTDPDFLAAVNK